MAIEKFEVVEPFKHGDRQFKVGEVVLPSEYSEAEVDAWHEAGWIHDLSPEPREDQPIVRGHHVIQPADVRAAAKLEVVK